MVTIEQGKVYITDGTVNEATSTISGDSATVPIKAQRVEHDTANTLIDIQVPVSPQNFENQAAQTWLVNLKRIKGSVKVTGEIASESSTNTWLRYKKLLLYLANYGQHPDTGNYMGKQTVTVVWELPEGIQQYSGLISKCLIREQASKSWKNVTDYTKQIPNKIDVDVQLIIGDLR